MGTSRRVHLRQIAVKNHCTVDWNGMRGDEAVRFCGSCKSSVHNLSAMSEDQVEQLLAQREDVCVRYYYRPDGTIVTSACGPSSRRVPSVAAVGVAGAIVYTSAFVGLSAAVDSSDPQNIAMHDEGVKVAMGMRLVVKVPKPRDPAERARLRELRERQRQLRHLAISDATPNLLPPEEADPAIDLQMPAAPVPTAMPVWPLAVVAGVGLVMALLLSSWLAAGIVPLGAMTWLGMRKHKSG